jgi:hypothetical protein
MTRYWTNGLTTVSIDRFTAHHRAGVMTPDRAMARLPVGDPSCALTFPARILPIIE